MDARVKIEPPAALSREGAFSAARSHSRRVRFLKFAVPAVAVAGAALFVFFAWFNPFRLDNVKVELGDVSVKNGKVEMKLPHLFGSNNRQQTFNVTAKSATQKVTAPDMVDLTSLEAVISMVDKSQATLTAATGKFDSNAQVLSLESDVHVKSTKGYDAAMQTGTIDFKAGTVHSNTPVTVNLANGTVSGKGLDIVEGGSKITFKGGVTAHFITLTQPGSKGAPAAGEATENEPAVRPQSSSANPVQGSPAP